MAISREKFNTPAIRGDVAGAVVAISGALNAVAAALRAINMGNRPTENDINDIQAVAEMLDKQFDDLTGYTNAD